ncbi:3-deoxy-D-manno-octulosonic acid kinase [Flocculibacter collagenilyticus]|uniref:3-deoxy-D-manno-octulosonic acid kinase n=1 Tax=Flocculibacter collagenilyticus TaxID=2744479 RepID=UPI0018F7536D|nr:3-deoxy-D-manno-octulosonic acid kinase [Flocculibacter collagenilyticus]
MTHEKIEADSDVIVYNPLFSYLPDAKWFTSCFWQKKGAISGKSKGRAITWFFRFKEHEFVLRHYYRGGLIGKFNKDLYIGMDEERSRAVKEFAMLKEMSNIGLPVPKPLAARIEKKWFCIYRADLIIERIANAKDLFQYLSKYPLNKSMWLKIGRTIADFHNNGVYHDDLNIHNIMLDKEHKCWLIDFDKGEIKKPSHSWQQENLKRLLRSFEKEKRQNVDLRWHLKDWDFLLQGYNEVINTPKKQAAH